MPGPRRTRPGRTRRPIVHPHTAPAREVRLGRIEPDSVAPAVFAVVERGCIKRPDLADELRCRLEIRFTDGFPRVRLTFEDAAVFVEDAPPDDPSEEPPGAARSIEELEAVDDDGPSEHAPDPMFDTAVRMGGFRPDLVVETSLPDLVTMFSMPFIRGVPKISDPRGREVIARVAAGRVKFRGNPLRARQLLQLLQV